MKKIVAMVLVVLCMVSLASVAAAERGGSVEVTTSSWKVGK